MQIYCFYSKEAIISQKFYEGHLDISMLFEKEQFILKIFKLSISLFHEQGDG